MPLEKPIKIGKAKLEQKKSERVQLSNGVYFDVKEKSRGVYEIIDFGKDGKSFPSMILRQDSREESFKT